MKGGTPRAGARARELRVQFAMVALALWTIAAVNTCTPTRYLRSGQIKGTDFVQFYGYALLAARGEAARFWDTDRAYELQVAAIPESSHLKYPRIYGPQVALALGPLGHLSYERALAVWVAFTAVACMGLVALVSAGTPAVRPYVGTALVGLAAFPPFWQLLQHGQLSVFAVIAVVAAWLALRRGHDALAGACLGMLAYKPQLFASVLAVLAFARAWRPLAAALAAGSAQILVCGLWIGVEGLVAYARQLLSLPGSARLLAARPERMHSLRTFWELLLPWTIPALVLYAATATAALAMAATVWRRAAEPGLRLSALCLAAVLAAPHLYDYDLIVLALVWIWLVDWHVRRGAPRHVTPWLYIGFLASLLGPMVPSLRVQVSTICVAVLLTLVWQATRQRLLPPPASPPRSLTAS